MAFQAICLGTFKARRPIPRTPGFRLCSLATAMGETHTVSVCTTMSTPPAVALTFLTRSRLSLCA